VYGLYEKPVVKLVILVTKSLDFVLPAPPVCRLAPTLLIQAGTENLNIKKTKGVFIVYPLIAN
jgi:hypothetical protein